MSLRKIDKHAIRSCALSLVSLQNVQIFRLLLKISVEGNTQMSISEFLTATSGGLITNQLTNRGQLTGVLDKIALNFCVLVLNDPAPTRGRVRC